MMLTVSDGVRFALGCLIVKVVFNVAAGLLDNIMYNVSPKYKKIKDDEEKKKHPLLYFLNQNRKDGA